MLDTPTSDWIDDFSQRYSNTWCWYVDGNKKTLVRITRVNVQRVEFVDKDGWEFKANVDGGAVFEFSQVPSGWYIDQEEKPWLFQRRPARQWKRGICEQNTYTYTIVNDRLILVDLTPQSLLSLENAGKTNSSVLSKFFCVTDSRVYCLNSMIGVREGNKISMLKPQFKQELSDAIRRSKNNYQIV